MVHDILHVKKKMPDALHIPRSLLCPDISVCLGNASRSSEETKKVFEFCSLK